MLFNLILVGLFSSSLVNCKNNKPLLQELLIPKNLGENQRIRLICALIEGEIVQFEWYKNDKRLYETNGRKMKYGEDSSELIIKSLSIDDLGEYKCLSRNEFGEDIQKVSLYFDGNNLIKILEQVFKLILFNE